MLYEFGNSHNIILFHAPCQVGILTDASKPTLLLDVLGKMAVSMYTSLWYSVCTADQIVNRQHSNDKLNIIKTLMLD